MDSVEAVEKILNYGFTNKTLLKEAITQISRGCMESSNLFQRLEFIGDSVLEVAVTNYIHLTYPNLEYREFRELHPTNVSNEKFARVAVKHNLYRFLIREDPSPSLDETIKEFTEAVGKEDEPAPYGGLVKAPKILADIVESIAGAVYIDVNFDLQRFWEIIRVFLEPIYTLDDIREQPEETFLALSRLGDKHGKRIDFRYYQNYRKEHMVEVYLDDKLIAASRPAKRIERAKLFAAKEALQKLSEHMPIEKITDDEDNLDFEIEAVKQKLFVICSTEKRQLQTGSSSFPTSSENPLLYEMTPNNTVIDDNSLHVELEDVKRKLFEICSAEKLELQTGSSSLPNTSENLLTYTQTKKVIGKDSPHVDPEDVKGKLLEIFPSRKLQIQTGSFSLPTAAENPLTYEMTTKPMVVDKDGLETGRKNAKRKLIIICAKNMWPNPIFSFVAEKGPKKVQLLVCSVKIEIPTIECTLHMKGDAELKKKDAENSSAFNMLRALESSLMSLVISNLQLPKSLDKKNPSLFGAEMDADSVEAVEKILNYSFVNKNLLKEALTHENLASCKHLMVVGEPALSLAFTNHIYLTYPKLETEELCRLRSANTSNDRYARVAVKKGIYQFFILSGLRAERKIIEFIELMGKEDDPDPDPYRSVKAPKYLSMLVDVVAGAVYIDVNYNVQRLWEIVRGLFEPIYTLDDLRRRAHPLLTLMCLGEKHNKRIEFRYGGKDEAKFAQVYIDDKFIACGYANKCSNAKRIAVKAALQKLSETMPIDMVMNEYIEYEDAKEKLIEICNKRKWPNPIYDSVESSELGFVYSVKIETPTEEGTLCIEGYRRKRRKIAENSSASLMIRALESPLTSLVISNLKIQKSLGAKKNLQIQESLQESLDEKKNPQMQESLDVKKNPQMQESLDEKKNLKMQESLKEKPQMQESLVEKKNQQMQERLDMKKNPQMQESLDEKKNLQMHESLKEKPQMQESLVEKKNQQMQESLNMKKNPQMQECLDEKKNPQIQESLDEKTQMQESLNMKKNPQMQECLDEKKNPQIQESLDEKTQMQESLDEKKNPQMHESLDVKKNPQMQESLDEKKNQQTQKSLDENKNLQMQESLDENDNRHSKKRKRR